MKNIILSSVLFAITLLFSGCGDNKPTLYVYNWSDYIDQEVVADFEREYGCHVVIDSFDDNETMLTKLMAGSVGYDVIFPSSYVIPVLVRNNLIVKLDSEKLPNVIANFDTKYSNLTHEYTMAYSVPYAFSMTGIAYRSDRTGNLPVEQSWNLLKDRLFDGRVSILSDIREMIGIGLIMNGKSINSTSQDDIECALDYIFTLKSVARKMDNSQYRVGLVSGEYYVAIGYQMDILQVKDENPDMPIEFFIPKEGSTCCWDEICIIDNGKVDLAHSFIDFLYRPDVAAKNSKYICTTVPNKGMLTLIDEDTNNNPLINVSSELLSRLELVKDVGDRAEIYNKAWDIFTTKHHR